MITDWDDAYSNGKYIEGADAYPARWANAAQTFRIKLQQTGQARLDIAYGRQPRHRLDLFLPEVEPKGLAVFVHGGYWLAFDKSSWSHLGRGAIERGWAVALPSYRLAPEASISAITGDIALAIAHAATLMAGPICLAGHSAGGHLVTRMACSTAPLAQDTQSRIISILTISGLHDLRPLQRTAMAPKLFQQPQEAAAESPALLEPISGIKLTCWVGAQERPELLRQTDLLANIWSGCGLDTRLHHAENCHHFNVIDELSDSNSEMVAALLG